MSGSGRGRGWLNLKTQNSINSSARPGSIASPTISNSISSNVPSDNTQFVDVSDEYSDLINKVKQLDVNDDGIKFNQKIKYILENWIQDCQTGNDVENSFEAIHQVCLYDAELASKLVLLVSSRTFLAQEIHDQNIRLMFLRKLQDNFESCIQLQAKNPTAFRNSIQMMGEFYNKARLANGQQLTFMATPLVSYLEMLLESAQLEDLQLFTTQLYLNGSSLRNEDPEKISEVLNTVRLTLASDKKLSRQCKLWLLLALEVTGNRFALLPPDIHKFYEEQLGDSAIASFQGTHGTLSVQTTHNSKALDSYQSKVNVLQVSTPPDSTNESISSPPSNNLSDYNSSKNFSSSEFQSDSSQNSSKSKKDGTHNSGKTGRPILGAGARLNKNRTNDDKSGNWRERDGGWNNKQKPSGHWDNKGAPKSSSKGWEHDDRFDTDYS